jgi:hypothetical protein
VFDSNECKSTVCPCPGKKKTGASGSEGTLHPEEHEMGLDFKTSVKCVRSVNSSLNEVTQRYNFRYVKLETMIGKGGRDEAFEEVGGKEGLYDRPMMRDFQKMQMALEQSGKSIRKLR